jgi:hypothetical protein
MSQSEARLDVLARDLQEAVERAARARQNAALIAQFETMQREISDHTARIGTVLPIVLDSPHFALTIDRRTELDDRRQAVRRQMRQVRDVLARDPLQVRQGSLWRDAKSSAAALANELEAALADAYRELLATFDGDDERLLDSLPPGTPGAAEYRTAIRDFETISERAPESLADVTRAVAAGRRLTALRDKLDAESIPAQFQTQWRALRGQGLQLDDITPEFSTWLRERGLARSVVAVYRAR